MKTIIDILDIKSDYTIKLNDGTIHYFNKDNVRHRLDGPAVEWVNGDKSWYYQGEYINCNSQSEFERIIRLKCLW